MDHVIPIAGVIALTIVALAVVAGTVFIARMIIDAVVCIKVARYTGIDLGSRLKPVANPENQPPSG